jgi:hypothetical protein
VTVATFYPPIISRYSRWQHGFCGGIIFLFHRTRHANAIIQKTDITVVFSIISHSEIEQITGEHLYVNWYIVEIPSSPTLLL